MVETMSMFVFQVLCIYLSVFGIFRLSLVNTFVSLLHGICES